MGEVFEDILDDTERAGAIREEKESGGIFFALKNLGLYEIAEKSGAFSKAEILRCDSED